MGAEIITAEREKAMTYRFVKEYANEKLNRELWFGAKIGDFPFVRMRIENVLVLFKHGCLTVDEAMKQIANAENDIEMQKDTAHNRHVVENYAFEKTDDEYCDFTKEIYSILHEYLWGELSADNAIIEMDKVEKGAN